MKTKAFVLATAAAVVFCCSAKAQVYSVNAVGYVRQSVPANGYAILANPLNTPDGNNINTVLPLPQDGTFDGANIFRFNRSTQSYRETMSFVSGPGWLAADPSDLIINPGEGFFVQNVATVSMPLTFLGEVPQGILSQMIQGNGGFNLIASIVPKSGRPGWGNNPNPGPDSLGIPLCDGDNIFIFDADCQCYRETYSYVPDFGWLHSTDPDPNGPLIEPGTGFWLQRTCATVTWTQSFSVN